MTGFWSMMARVSERGMFRWVVFPLNQERKCGSVLGNYKLESGVGFRSF
jgi:hypothetical protein